MSDFAMDAVTGRFSTLLSRHSCPKPLYDEVLNRLHNCIVAPTLGSIVPNWLLVIPEEPILNFREWNVRTSVAPERLVKDLLGHWGIRPDRALWFEHGPAAAGSTVGCGVDHAHLHVLIDAPFSFVQMVSAASNAGHLHFRRAMTTNAYGVLPISGAYLALASGEEVYFAENVEHVGSQFLRRVIADLVDCRDGWNYRTHAHLDNVQKTIQAFRAA